MGISKYEKLNDKDWLVQKYLVEKRSTKEIVKLAGAKTANSARQALIKFGIPLRSVSEGLTCNREDDGFVIDQSVIDGCLLGDGTLGKYNKESDRSFPYFKKRNKYQDHVTWVGSLLFVKPFESRVTFGEEECNGKLCPVYTLRGLSRQELLPYFKRWYPLDNEFEKVIPEDIDPTPELLLHWFLDDGFSYRRKRKYTGQQPKRHRKQIKVAMCSECFQRGHQEILCEKIRGRYGLNPKTYPYQGSHRIGFPQSQSQAFYEIIGPSPVKSLAYKWK